MKGLRMPTIKFMHLDSVRLVRAALRWKATITACIFLPRYDHSICVNILSIKPASQQKLKIPKQRKEVTPK
jgi:hypothetical protein